MAEQKQPFKGFVGESYRDPNPRYDCQRTVNYILQFDESGAGKEKQVSAFLQRPGLTLVQTLSPGPIRCLQTLSDNATIIAVSGNQVYQIENASGIPVNITGTMGTDNGYCTVSDNGGYVIISDGTSTYYTFQLGATSFTAQTSANYYPSNQVTYQDGFFLFNSPGTATVFTSQNSAPEGTSGGGGPITFGDSNYAVKQGYADVVTGIISNGRELFVFGAQTTEVWYDSGSSVVFDFTREDGKNSTVGCISPATICQLAGTIFWLGQNAQGGAIVYNMNGYTPNRISTKALEYAMSQLGDLSQATAFGMQWQGHYFYVLQLPGSSTTWVFDQSGVTETNPTPGTWTEWQSTQANNSQGQFLASTHAYVAGQHLLGDTNNGNLYLWDPTACTDNGAMLYRSRTTPHVSKNLNNCFYKLLQVDFLAGQGLVNNGTNPTNAVNPQAVLEMSDDGGQTYGDPVFTDLGQIGQYYMRARWQQLGVARDRVFRVTVTDPVIAHIVTAVLDYEVGYA